ncbi:MAG: ComF family protein, partial [Bacteroidota bacterium]
MSQMRMLKSFLQLLFLHRCYACEGELLEQESYVCFSCLSQIPETSFHLHPADNEMFYRLAGKVEIKSAASLYYFDKKGRLQSLLEALKYKSAPEIGRHLGKLYGRKLNKQAWV